MAFNNAPLNASALVSDNKNVVIGILFAILAAFVWSGNFIVARGVYTQIDPIALAFFRWLTASVILTIIAYKKLRINWLHVKQHIGYLLLASFMGVALFNTLVYVAGHYSSAINLALIGTTSSPVFTFILAALLLKEKIPAIRFIGLLICIAGILYLLSKGHPESLRNLSFGIGDLWVLLAGLVFAAYNIIVRKKPKVFNGTTYLWLTFWMGTIMLLPAFVIEQQYSAPIVWSSSLWWAIVYLGAGASVAAFFAWNESIARLGAARTSLFGNLIPIFSSIEAVIILHEQLYFYHYIGMAIVATGLVLANSIKRK